MPSKKLSSWDPDQIDNMLTDTQSNVWDKITGRQKINSKPQSVQQEEINDSSSAVSSSDYSAIDTARASVKGEAIIQAEKPISSEVIKQGTKREIKRRIPSVESSPNDSTMDSAIKRAENSSTISIAKEEMPSVLNEEKSQVIDSTEGKVNSSAIKYANGEAIPSATKTSGESANLSAIEEAEDSAITEASSSRQDVQTPLQNEDDNVEGREEANSTKASLSSMSVWHSEPEQRIYEFMYKCTVARRIKTWYFTEKDLCDKTGIKSTHTVRTALRGLMDKMTIEPKTGGVGNRFGREYRVYAPYEVLSRRRKSGIKIHPQTKRILEAENNT